MKFDCIELKWKWMPRMNYSRKTPCVFKSGEWLFAFNGRPYKHEEALEKLNLKNRDAKWEIV
jgi:hypothetical protein